MSACIYDDYPSPPEGTDTMLANARRIARVPDLEAAYLALADENARLRAALAEISDRHIPDQPAAFGGDELQWAQRQHGQLRALARAALGETK